MFNVVSDGLEHGTLALLKMEGNGLDSSKNRFDFRDNTGGVSVTYTDGLDVPFGRYAASKFIHTGAFFNSPTAFKVAFFGSQSWSMEFLMRWNTIANGPCIFSFNNNATDASIWVARILATGALRMVANNAVVADSAAGTIVINRWYRVSITCDGTNMRAYVSDLYSTTSNPASTLNVSAHPIANVTLFQLGYEYLSASFNTDGYMKNVRFSTVAKTKFPTMD